MEEWGCGAPVTAVARRRRMNLRRQEQRVCELALAVRMRQEAALHRFVPLRCYEPPPPRLRREEGLLLSEVARGAGEAERHCADGSGAWDGSAVDIACKECGGADRVGGGRWPRGCPRGSGEAERHCADGSGAWDGRADIACKECGGADRVGGGRWPRGCPRGSGEAKIQRSKMGIAFGNATAVRLSPDVDVLWNMAARR